MWGLDEASIGGSGSVPRFSVSFSCNPPPNIPASDAPDQSLTFNVRTSYTCTVNLTPTSGGDQRVQSREFSFATGAGQLIVTSPSYNNAVLREDVNNGGLIFNNEDANTVAITGLDIDISYTALNVTDGPLVLRVVNPTTELPLAEYHLENLAVDPSLPYTHSGKDFTISFSFAIGPATQKLLPIQVLGTRRMSISGVDPTVSIKLRGVRTDQSGGKIVLKTDGISWSCIVPVGIYDPNATSGPYVTGRACQ